MRRGPRTWRQRTNTMPPKVDRFVLVFEAYAGAVSPPLQRDDQSYVFVSCARRGTASPDAAVRAIAGARRGHRVVVARAPRAVRARHVHADDVRSVRGARWDRPAVVDRGRQRYR